MLKKEAVEGEGAMRVVIADDDRVSRKLLEATLQKWGYEVEVCQDGLEAWEVLRSRECHCLAILDWMMPGMDGPEVCRKVREHGSEPYVYILLLTSRSEKGDTVAGLEAGADDYLIKPFEAQELKVRLHVGRRSLDLQNELIETREALRIQATHDALTGIWNRRAIVDSLTAEVARSKRDGNPLGIAMVDIDHFKRINDLFGHQVGDAVLTEIADRLKNSLRPYDRIGRYGGEEFLAVLHNVNLSGAGRIGERMRQSLSDSEFKLDQESLSLTCSIGIACTDQCDEFSEESLVKAADKALFEAKLAGRNRVATQNSEDSAVAAGLNSRQ